MANPFDPTSLLLSAVGATFPQQTDTDGWTIADQVYIADTTAHTYRTDPLTMALVPLGQQSPSIAAWGVWVYNQTDQEVTVQVIGNQLLPTGTASPTNPAPPDYTVGNPQTVPAGATGFLTTSFASLPAEYLGVQLQFSTAPTNGMPVSAVVLLYYS